MHPPDWITAVILGILEGLTEFIPVSSTGHLLLAERWLPRQSDLFNIVIQSGAVVAVIPIFWRRCAGMLSGWRQPARSNDLLKLLAAFAITGIGGLALDKLGFRLPESDVPVAWALIAGGVLFVAIERWLKGRPQSTEISWGMVAAVGIAQLVAAVFPGLSRSGATILVMLAMGLARPAATEFSFILGIPTLLAAGGLKILKALLHNGAGEDWAMVAVGTLVSAAVSFAAVKWLLRYIQSHTFTAFGWYRMALGAAVLALAALR